MARVLRIPCHDDDTSFVLVHVNGSAGGSSRPLDLTLVGTEGTAPYNFRCKPHPEARLAWPPGAEIHALTKNLATVKQSKVPSLKSKNGPCTQDEWAIILESILLGTLFSDNHAELFDGIETVASVQENKSIDITIRKRIEGITQRLGALNLSHDGNQEIELFEWCGIAVQSTSNASNELASFKSKFQEQRETISKLNAQLEELIAAKAKHETALLGKFRDLLNEKKIKIRDQQRLLAAAKVDPEKLAAVQASRKSNKKTTASPSRTGKRKAGKDEDDEDEGFERMDVDVDQVPNDSEQRDIETPDDDETETADEDDDVVPQTVPPAANTWQAGKGKGKANAGNSVSKNSSSNTSKQDQEMEDDPPKTPPRRELPFAKKKQPDAKPPVQDDEETASEDDEL